MSSVGKLVLVDGSSYLYRAFHALPPLTTSKGEPTGALLGVVNMLQKLMKEEQPAWIAVVFDAPGKTFRDQLFEQYKANRTPMPDDLRPQIQPLLDIVTAMGLPLLRIEGVEADDVIGTLATRAAKQEIPVLISTGDKDMAQLVDGHITLVNTMTDSRLDRAGVKAKFDVYPEQMIDYLALVGDSIDNIPGIDKVGPKTAAKWLAQYSNLDEIIKHAAEIPGKVGDNLRAGLKDLELSRKLATIHCDLELDVPLETLRQTSPDEAKLRDLYTRFELRSLLKQLTGADTASSEAPTVAELAVQPAVAANYETVLTEDALQRWVDRCKQADLFGIDVLTSSGDYMIAEIVGVALCVNPGEAAYIPMAHVYPGASQLAKDKVLEALRPLLESERPGKIGHDLKFDAHVLGRYGIELRGVRYDSMLESYVWNSTATDHSLEKTAAKYLGIQPRSYEELAGKGAKQITFDQVEVERGTDYGAEQSDLPMRLHQTLWPQIEKEGRLAWLYNNLEQPLEPVLVRMERAGVLLDIELLRRQSGEIAKRMQEMQIDCHRAAAGAFNLDSPKQLQEILFGKLGIPVLRKTATGQPSTAEDVLEELAEQHELPRLILEYRSISKLKSTYTDKLPAQVNAQTRRVHTSYRQAVAATGRLSSSDPNLQNIPIRTLEGRRIRQAFIAPPGHRLIAADYSQIELRIMAHLSGDAGLLKAFAENRDIHQATAAEVFAVPLPDVTHNQRRSAKAINFGLIYGMSAFGLARQLGIERGEAQKYVDLYFQRYPGVKRYMDDTRALARDRGYVETVFGRRLYLPDIKARNAALRQYAERAAINAPMQGTAADIIKLAMVSVDAWLVESKLPARLIMQVHDELFFEVAECAVEELSAQVRAHMMSAASLNVPLAVDIGVGGNWDEAH